MTESHAMKGNSLNDILKAIVETQEGRFSWQVLALDEEGPATALASFQENMLHQSASMIKVFILECLFHEAQTGRVHLDERMMLSEVPRVEGGGALQELMGRHAFTLLELSRLMMVLSDNMATNLLCKRLTLGTINARIQSLGMTDTKLERLMMDTKAMAEGRDNWTTVTDLARLFTHVYRKREEPLWGNEMWRILGRQQFRDKIPFYWGEETPFFHKTGCLDNVEHDGGIYTSIEGDFIIIILASDVRTNADGISSIAHMGNEVRTYVQERYVRR